MTSSFKKIGIMKFFLIFCAFMLITMIAIAQYPKKLAWDNINAGDGISFSIKAEIAEPSYGMHYVTYSFTNHSSFKLRLYWTTTLELSNGLKIYNEHELNFKAGQTLGMGWTHSESDVIDINERGGKITNVLINSIRAEIEQQEHDKIITEDDRKTKERKKRIGLRLQKIERLKREQEKIEKRTAVRWKTWNTYQNQLKQHVDNGNDMIDRVSSFASEEVEDGELRGEFVFFGVLRLLWVNGC
jgi:hypothetical protein